MALHAHKMLKVEYDPDKVVLAGVVVPRPPGVSVSQWLEYWERVCKFAEKSHSGVRYGAYYEN